MYVEDLPLGKVYSDILRNISQRFDDWGFIDISDGSRVTIYKTKDSMFQLSYRGIISNQPILLEVFEEDVNVYHLRTYFGFSKIENNHNNKYLQKLYLIFCHIVKHFNIIL